MNSKDTVFYSLFTNVNAHLRNFTVMPSYPSSLTKLSYTSVLHLVCCTVTYIEVKSFLQLATAYTLYVKKLNGFNERPLDGKDEPESVFYH